MRRTEIELTEEQAERIEELAASGGCSVSDIIRASVDRYIARVAAKDQAIRAIGAFRSTVADLGSGHDKYLAEDLTK